jgi:hypothetical protein
VTRLAGASVFLTTTGHLVVSFAGYTGVVRIPMAEAAVYQALITALADEEAGQDRRLQQTAKARAMATGA